MPSAYANVGEIRSVYDVRANALVWIIHWLDFDAQTTTESYFAKMSALSATLCPEGIGSPMCELAAYASHLRTKSRALII